MMQDNRQEKIYLRYFSYLHQLKYELVLEEVFLNIFTREGHSSKVCQDKATAEVLKLKAKIDQWHEETLDLTEENYSNDHKKKQQTC